MVSKDWASEEAIRIVRETEIVKFLTEKEYLLLCNNIAEALRDAYSDGECEYYQ